MAQPEAIHVSHPFCLGGALASRHSGHFSGPGDPRCCIYTVGAPNICLVTCGNSRFPTTVQCPLGSGEGPIALLRHIYTPFFLAYPLLCTPPEENNHRRHMEARHATAKGTYILHPSLLLRRPWIMQFVTGVVGTDQRRSCFFVRGKFFSFSW